MKPSMNTSQLILGTQEMVGRVNEGQAQARILDDDGAAN
jgi:hypothetical protein